MCQLSHNNDTRPRNRIKLWSRDFKITGYVKEGCDKIINGITKYNRLRCLQRYGCLVLKIKSEKKTI